MNARYFHESRGHNEELRGVVDVRQARALQVLDVPVEYPRYRDVVDVDLLLLDEPEEQVERPAVDVEVDLVGHGYTSPRRHGGSSGGVRR